MVDKQRNRRYVRLAHVGIPLSDWLKQIGLLVYWGITL